jgi:hypothetical protein
MRIIGCDLHARQQTLAMLDTRNGRGCEDHSAARGQQRARVLLQTSPIGTCGNRSHRFHAVVCEPRKNSESNVWLVIRQRFERPNHENRNMIGEMRTYSCRYW